MVKSVLFAEDDEDDRMFILEALEGQENIVPSFACNGYEVSAVLQDGAYNPDVIFLDLNMPLKDGVECLKEIKSNPNHDACMVIMLTTSQNPEDMRLCYEIGADLFVVKPSDITVLKDILTTVIHKSSLKETRPSFEDGFVYK